MKILVGSPVRKSNEIVSAFLRGLVAADKGDCEFTYFFVDDNIDTRSSELLRDFAENNDVIIKKGTEIQNELKLSFEDFGDEDHRLWRSDTLLKITAYKDYIIDYCIAKKFDYLFLIDSDIVLDSRAIMQLLSRDVEICAEVFYSQWQHNGKLTPQCFWIPGVFDQESDFNVHITGEEAMRVISEMHAKLREPGLHPVDGTGACTMIKRSALEKGCRFEPVFNLSVPGEDRPFCIRAGVAGIQLYMDTVCPCYHIAKEKYLDRVDEFMREGFKFDMCCEYEPEEKKRKLNLIEKFILRCAKKIVRELTV